MKNIKDIGIKELLIASVIGTYVFVFLEPQASTVVFPSIMATDPSVVLKYLMSVFLAYFIYLYQILKKPIL